MTANFAHTFLEMPLIVQELELAVVLSLIYLSVF